MKHKSRITVNMSNQNNADRVLKQIPSFMYDNLNQYLTPED